MGENGLHLLLKFTIKPQHLPAGLNATECARQKLVFAKMLDLRDTQRHRLSYKRKVQDQPNQNDADRLPHVNSPIAPRLRL